MTYQETIDYLFHKLPMFNRIGAAAFKNDITNTVRLCEALDQPQQKFKSIHIAGTNGKGSTSHMLAAILQTAGYKTGLYTSPHLKDFRERIKVNGRQCDEQFVIDFTERIKPLIEEIEPSFFEITVAMAFEYFVQQEVDIAIIEVGLGGRLDSTNVIHPELSVITNIGWDHMNLLGDTLEKIAFEKAGIIKPHVPVVIGEISAESRPVFEAKASSVETSITFAQENQYVTGWKFDNNELSVEIANSKSDDRIKYALDLPGIYQTKNLLTVLEAVKQLNLKGWQLSHSVVQKALTQVKPLTGLQGRWEIIHRNPLVVLDVGHNIDGIKQIVEQIALSTYTSLHIIIGMVKDKEVEKVLELLPPHARYYFTNAHIPRAMDAKDLMEKAAHFSLKGNIYADVNIALQAALTHAQKEDMILVCGSVFLVGELTH